ncbi:hypothetical protein AGOR_G00122620 [Albula goreensis]|uniref:Cytochrome c oxidase subunit 7A1, mitochondrial n=1 Tax=Albula goreensis TaxID=1534307 RepID=A0A8T3D9A9_9TELE|nr:hypothetical protein AGOR_G00122620 [Albula goreensis]
MRHLQIVPQFVTRAFSTTSRQMKNRVPEYQRLFQANNDLPVHIKGGTTDVVLYRFTMAITLGGTCLSLYWLLTACQPRNK